MRHCCRCTPGTHTHCMQHSIGRPQLSAVSATIQVGPLQDQTRSFKGQKPSLKSHPPCRPPWTPGAAQTAAVHLRCIVTPTSSRQQHTPRTVTPHAANNTAECEATKQTAAGCLGACQQHSIRSSHSRSMQQLLHALPPCNCNCSNGTQAHWAASKLPSGVPQKKAVKGSIACLSQPLNSLDFHSKKRQGSSDQHNFGLHLHVQ